MSRYYTNGRICQLACFRIIQTFRDRIKISSPLRRTECFDDLLGNICCFGVSDDISPSIIDHAQLNLLPEPPAMAILTISMQSLIGEEVMEPFCCSKLAMGRGEARGVYLRHKARSLVDKKERGVPATSVDMDSTELRRIKHQTASMSWPLVRTCPLITDDLLTRYHEPQATAIP